MSEEDRVDGTLGRIALRRVAVKRSETPDRTTRKSVRGTEENPANKLVPYLDLFSRLDDAELSRLADIAVEFVSGMRAQIAEVEKALSSYADLIDRLSEPELVRLTQASPKTVRFWLLCQPRDRPEVIEPLRPGDSGIVAVMPASASQSGTAAIPVKYVSSNSASGSMPKAGQSSTSRPVLLEDEDEELVFDDDDDFF